VIIPFVWYKDKRYNRGHDYFTSISTGLYPTTTSCLVYKLASDFWSSFHAFQSLFQYYLFCFPNSFHFFS